MLRCFQNLKRIEALIATEKLKMKKRFSLQISKLQLLHIAERKNSHKTPVVLNQ